MPDQPANVVGLPLPEPERYVDRRAMAGIMGISLRAFDALCAEGRREGFPPPCEDWGMRAIRFPPSRTIAWARAFAARRKAA